MATATEEVVEKKDSKKEWESLLERIKSKTEGYVHEVLHPKMHVVPLRDGEIARYKMIEADKKDKTRVDEQNNPLPQRPSYGLIGKKKIYDPYLKRTVHIIAPMKTSVKKSPMGDIKTERPQLVKFLSDKILEVKHTDPELYAFLERVDENRDNPFRKKGKAWFFRIDAKKKAHHDLEKTIFEFDAQEWVMRKASYDELKACAAKVCELRTDAKIKFDYPADQSSMGYDLLKRELYEFARKDPHTVIKACSDTKMKMKMQVRDAEHFNIIVFFDGQQNQGSSKYRKWCFNDKDVTEICDVPQTVHKYDSLIEKFTSSGGEKLYEKMVKELKEVLTPR